LARARSSSSRLIYPTSYVPHFPISTIESVPFNERLQTCISAHLVPINGLAKSALPPLILPNPLISSLSFHMNNKNTEAKNGVWVCLSNNQKICFTAPQQNRHTQKPCQKATASVFLHGMVQESMPPSPLAMHAIPSFLLSTQFIAPPFVRSSYVYVIPSQIHNRSSTCPLRLPTHRRARARRC
jgi:hypothetical protein